MISKNPGQYILIPVIDRELSDLHRLSMTGCRTKTVDSGTGMYVFGVNGN